MKRKQKERDSSDSVKAIVQFMTIIQNKGKLGYGEGKGQEKP